MTVCRPHTSCRVCGAKLGEPYLDLGEQPLANNLLDPSKPHPKMPGALGPWEFRAPLQVILCEQCGLSQLSVVVNPEILYSGYRFRSGASEGWVKHCEELAKRCTKEMGDFPPKKVLDIAANDGTQLRPFASRGWECLGVDPSPVMQNMREHIIRGFWGEALASNILAVHGKQDLVIAQNVLGHVDDPIGFLKAIKTVLAPEGRVVVEVPNVDCLILNGAFDTIYHEHLSYWSSRSLRMGVDGADLQVDDSEAMLDIHGGSIRYWLSHKRPAEEQVIMAELSRESYVEFARRVRDNLNMTWLLLGKRRVGKLLGWGAAAKAAVYLNAMYNTGNEDWPSAVIDETPEKVGLLMPGVHLPIIAPPDDLSDVDVIWILVWNWKDQVKAKARARGFKGKFLVAIPEPRLED